MTMTSSHSFISIWQDNVLATTSLAVLQPGHRHTEACDEDNMKPLGYVSCCTVRCSEVAAECRMKGWGGGEGEWYDVQG